MLPARELIPANVLTTSGRADSLEVRVRLCSSSWPPSVVATPRDVLISTRPSKSGLKVWSPLGTATVTIEHGPRGFVRPCIGRQVGRLDRQVHIGVGVLEGVGDEVRSRLDTLAEGVCLTLRHHADGGGIAGDGVPALAAVQGREAEGSLLESLAQCPCHAP